MTREELKKGIRDNEREIIKRLDCSGIFSYEEYFNGDKRLSNKEFGKCTSYFYKGFFDNYYGDLVKKITYNKRYSIENYMNNKFLEYKLVWSEELRKYLERNFLTCREDLEGFKNYSKNVGVLLRKEYINEMKSTPIRDFVYLNSVSYLRDSLREKVDKLMDKDENILRFNTFKYRDFLLKELPKKFNEKEAYGRLVGALNETFYGEKSSGIMDALRRNKVKVKDRNLIDFMNKDHLVYRFVAFDFMKKYVNKYDELECNDFLKKVLSLGDVLKGIFKENYNSVPLYDLISCCKERENEGCMKYKLSKESKTVIVDDSVQISMFSNDDEKIR